ncbi:MAG: winged helix-turn-helix transcriptional regulator [Clostridiales bacterium]|nr:winged helix-turn-helix transcriptional regulator [Clostridiales bacterium]
MTDIDKVHECDGGCEHEHTHKLPHDHGTNTLEIFEKSYENKSFEEVADLFSLVSDSTRLKIFSLLCHTEDCVINIAAAVGMSSPAVSHHLRVLKQSHLIGSRKVGKEVYYTVAETKEAELLHGAVDRMMEICCNK